MTLFDSGVPYTRLINTAANNGQRYRMMRYVMVLGIILVTIFLYVSYYTTPMSSVDSRYSPSFLVQDQSGYEPAGSLGAAVAASAAVKSSTGNGSQKETQPEKRSEDVVAPSEGTRNEEDVVVSSSSNNESKKEAVPELVEQNSVPQTTFLSQNDPKQTEALIQRAKSNASITIPRVVLPPKKDILTKLANVTKTATPKSPKAASGNKLTREVFEPGFMDPAEDLCPENGRNIRLLALIHSAPSHTEARYAIRQTWGHFGSRRDIAIGFLVGRTSNATWDENLRNEQFMYGDIVRSNSFDSYDNLTLKTIAMLEWTVAYCNEARFLLKVDDDMFINVPKLLDFTNTHWNDTRQIYGRLAKKWRPIRNKKSKYYVSPALYAPKNFPDFVTGPSYLLTTDMLRELYDASLTHAFLKLEDVYMTGIISEMVGVKRKHVNEFLNRRIAFNPCAVRKAISIHMVKGKEQFDLWKKLLDVDLKCK